MVCLRRTFPHAVTCVGVGAEDERKKCLHTMPTTPPPVQMPAHDCLESTAGRHRCCRCPAAHVQCLQAPTGPTHRSMPCCASYTSPAAAPYCRPKTNRLVSYSALLPLLLPWPLATVTRGPIRTVQAHHHALPSWHVSSLDSAAQVAARVAVAFGWLEAYPCQVPWRLSLGTKVPADPTTFPGAPLTRGARPAATAACLAGCVRDAPFKA